MKTNPWRNLPLSQPYVLPEDSLAVDVFNRDLKTKPEHRLHTDTSPEPFCGRWDAPIVVLLLNPGVDKTGRYNENTLAALRTGEPDPFHQYIAGANPWWTRLVKKLERTDIERSILSVEFFPYRSVSFGCGHVRLPSQEFSFDLVRRAIARKAAIVVLRGERQWVGAIPELVTECELIRISNPRAASLSVKNLGEASYQRLLGAGDPTPGERKSSAL